MNDNSQLVNGPFNIIRMEGTINGINKVIYIMMEYHMEVSNQTQCSDINSVDISKYMYSNMKQYSKMDNDKSIDFFFEYYKSEINNKVTNNKERYIDEVNKIINASIKFDKNKITNINPDVDSRKIRMHYLDIRDILTNDYYSLIGRLPYELNNILSQDFFMHENNIKYFSNLLKLYENALNNVYYAINDKNNNSKLSNKIDFINLFDKIKNKYKYKNIKDILNNELKITFNQIYDYMKVLLKNIKKCFIEYKKHIVDYSTKKLIYIENGASGNFNWSDYSLVKKVGIQLFNLLWTLHYDFFYPFVSVTDIYMLRRFLDKDYITNAVVYTGFSHSINYIHILFYRFNFKVTHTSFMRADSIDQLNKKLEKIYSKSENDIIHDLSLKDLNYLFLPDFFSQCSNISHFPKFFQ